MSNLSAAVQAVKLAGELDLNFEELTDEFWQHSGNEILYSQAREDITEDTGEAYSLEVRWEVDRDENYVRFHIDNGCGDRYDVVFSLDKHVEE